MRAGLVRSSADEFLRRNANQSDSDNTSPTRLYCSEGLTTINCVISLSPCVVVCRRRECAINQKCLAALLFDSFHGGEDDDNNCYFLNHGRLESSRLLLIRICLLHSLFPFSSLSSAVGRLIFPLIATLNRRLAPALICKTKSPPPPTGE